MRVQVWLHQLSHLRVKFFLLSVSRYSCSLTKVWVLPRAVWPLGSLRFASRLKVFHMKGGRLRHVTSAMVTKQWP